jgi:hypothetical protein
MKRLTLFGPTALAFLLFITPLAYSQNADRVLVLNTQMVNSPPEDYLMGVRFDFKYNSTISMTPGNGYSGLMTFAPWSDGSAGPYHHLAFNSNGLFWRTGQRNSPWGSWNKLVTTDPAGHLKLNGTNGATSHAQLTFHRADGAKFASIGQGDLAAANSTFDISHFNGNDIRFMQASVEQMRLKANGMIGIGTASPSGKLDIFGNSNSTVNLVLSANYPDKFRWRVKTEDRSNAIDLDFTSSDGSDIEETVLKLTRSNSTRPEFQLYNNAIVANDGNIGLGVAAPADKLEVVGNVRIRGNGGNSTHSELTFYRGDGAKTASIGPSGLTTTNSPFEIREWNGNDIRIVTSNLERLRIRSDGNVGIGTTDPTKIDSKLTVAGVIHSQEVKVTVSAGADFVFADDYSLRPLSEVETFIRQNKHLPEIAPASEMESDGVQVGKMQIKLLQKVEELTLYLIELKKEVEDLKSANAKLQVEVNAKNR